MKCDEKKKEYEEIKKKIENENKNKNKSQYLLLRYVFPDSF